MTSPHVPGVEPVPVELPCGNESRSDEFDLNMREFACRCGSTHAVVMDVHPPTRFVPSDVMEVLTATTETTDERAFDTIHLMGLVLEEFPEQVSATDVSEGGVLGCQYIWVTAFDSRRLHVVLIELILEMMEHAMSHSEDNPAREEFLEMLEQFDPEAFVDSYRDRRDQDADGAG